MPFSYENGTAEYTVHRLVAKPKLNYLHTSIIIVKRLISISLPIDILRVKIIIMF